MFYSYIDDLTQRYSAWNYFPTKENPNSLYKFTSIEINLNKDLKQINRQTYSLLDWLGDAGGLLDALFFIAETIVEPFSLFALQSKLVSLLVKF